MTDISDLQHLLTSRFRVNDDLPTDLTQLLNKLVDVPMTRANSVQRIPRNATEVNDEIQCDHVWRRRA